MKRTSTLDAISDLHPQSSRLDCEPSGFDSFFAQQHSQNLLRLIIFSDEVESKSMLIDRFPSNTQQRHDGQIPGQDQDVKDGKLAGMQYSILNGRKASGQDNKSDDVSYHFFASRNRQYILADVPADGKFTESIIAAASTAKVAVLMVDARIDLIAQVRRYAYLISLMGIRHVLLAINKIDLVNYDSLVCQKIRTAFESFAKPLGFDSIVAIPVSTLQGDNVIEASKNMAWYAGPVLLDYLDAINDRQAQTERFVFPLQLVNRSETDFNGLCGTVAEGHASVGDEVRVTLSGQTAKITAIIGMDGSSETAVAGDAVSLCLDSNIAVSPGDILSLAKYSIETTDQFTATLIWFHQKAGIPGRSYDIKLLSQWSSASVTSIKHRIDGDTQELLACKQIECNDIVVCDVALGKSLAFDAFKNSQQLGSFILVDRESKETLACGMILHDLRRAQNVHAQALSITRSDRERRNGHAGKVIWFTGLSGSGKSTLANSLDMELHGRGLQTYILDGDNVRQGLNKDLGFTEADRVENIRRIAEVAKLMLDAGMIVMTAFISPFRREREMARELIGAENFIEVYVSTPLEVCEERDVKGLYKKARDGKIPNMTGINSPYEAPANPSYIIDHDVPIELITKDLALHILADN